MNQFLQQMISRLAPAEAMTADAQPTGLDYEQMMRLINPQPPQIPQFIDPMASQQALSRGVGDAQQGFQLAGRSIAEAIAQHQQQQGAINAQAIVPQVSQALGGQASAPSALQPMMLPAAGGNGLRLGTQPSLVVAQQPMQAQVMPDMARRIAALRTANGGF